MTSCPFCDGVGECDDSLRIVDHFVYCAGRRLTISGQEVTILHALMKGEQIERPYPSSVVEAVYRLRKKLKETPYNVIVVYPHGTKERSAKGSGHYKLVKNYEPLSSEPQEESVKLPPPKVVRTRDNDGREPHTKGSNSGPNSH